ncbi:MAG: HIT family protein [Chloroflexi bacterium]|nr:HIT family protein [Chloroflexota bacterium]
MTEGCIFCDIVRGDAPASMVYRDEVCCAFMDILPVNPGHVLVIPNAHATYLADLPEETVGHLFRVGQRIAAAARQSAIRCEGVNLFLADGRAAGQEVSHVHLHVIPRFMGDGFGLRFGPRNRLVTPRQELDRVAARIRERLAVDDGL